MSYQLYRPPYALGLAADGASFPYAHLLFLAAGEDAHALPAYADENGAQPFEGALVADAEGLLPDIWLDPTLGYRVEWRTAGGTLALAQDWGWGAPRGVGPWPHDGGLFSGLSALSIPPEVSHLRTLGWSVPGKGGGDYVSDASATPELAAAHPRFAVVTANGRCFRLAAAQGLITVEQGGATGDPEGQGRVNDQPAIQATVTYAAAVGVPKVGFAQACYSLWAPKRTSDPTGTQTAIDGHPLVVTPEQKVHLLGLLPGRSRLAYWAPNGRSFQIGKAGVGYQLVLDKVWRGGGIVIEGLPKLKGQTRPTNIGALIIENLELDGGTSRTGSSHWPAYPTDGTGWDTSHKCIWLVADHWSSDVSILNCYLHGWRGETVYASNDTSSKLTVYSSRCSDSEGQGLNPNACQVDVQNCWIDNCFIGVEGWTGAEGGKILGLTISNCNGGAFRLQGGTAPRSGGYTTPTRVNPAIPPVGTIDITCRNCGSAMIGWWITGRLVLEGTALVLGEGVAYSSGSQYVDLDITLIDSPTHNALVAILGGQGKQGEMRTDHCRLSISIPNPPLSPARLGPPVTWGGSLGDDIRIKLQGLGKRRAPYANIPQFDYAPHFL